MLCVFLRGVGIVGATPTQDVSVDLQGHDSHHERELDLDIRDVELK